jgi:putative Holliday junction resolvase
LRFLGLDYGQGRIGVAVGDAHTRLARPHSVFRHKGWGPDVKRVKALMAQTGAQAVVLGLPRNIGERLLQEGIPVRYQDERLTSFEAEEAMRAGGLDSRQIREKVDQTAACLILERYLDSLGYNE